MPGNGNFEMRDCLAPSFSALPFKHSGTGRMIPLLSDRERERIAEIGTKVHFSRGSTIQRQGDRITYIYNLVDGAMKASHISVEGRETIVAFLFPGDLVGLAENGKYLNTVTTLEPVSAYRLPLSALETLISTDPELELHLLCKVCHDLREAQRHAILLASDNARTKVILFLHLLLVQQCLAEGDDAVVQLPMTRVDIANYTGLTMETISRTLQNLDKDGVLKIMSPRTIRIVDRAQFDDIVRASGPARNPVVG